MTFDYRLYSLKPKGGLWQPWTWIQSSQVHTLRKHVSDHDIALSLWEFETPDKTARKTGDLYLDFDGSLDDVEKARLDAVKTVSRLEEHYGIDPSTLQIVFSGRRGFLVIVPKESFLTEPIPEPHKAYKKFVDFLKFTAPTLDSSLYCKNHLVRMTNSVHQETGLYRIQLRPDELRSLSVEEIKKLATQPRAVPRKTAQWSKELAAIFEKIQRHKPAFQVKRIPSVKRTDRPSLDILSLIDASKMVKSGGCYQGAHPVHGSENGMNFRLDSQKGVWYCYRHQTGGGVFELLAMLEGIIDCSDSRKGCLRGRRFGQVLDVAREKHGVNVSEGYSKEAVEYQPRRCKDVAQ